MKSLNSSRIPLNRNTPLHWDPKQQELRNRLRTRCDRQQSPINHLSADSGSIGLKRYGKGAGFTIQVCNNGFEASRSKQIWKGISSTVSVRKIFTKALVLWHRPETVFVNGIGLHDRSENVSNKTLVLQYRFEIVLKRQCLYKPGNRKCCKTIVLLWNQTQKTAQRRYLGATYQYSLGWIMRNTWAARQLATLFREVKRHWYYKPSNWKRWKTTGFRPSNRRATNPGGAVAILAWMNYSMRNPSATRKLATLFRELAKFLPSTVTSYQLLLTCFCHVPYCPYHEGACPGRSNGNSRGQSHEDEKAERWPLEGYWVGVFCRNLYDFPRIMTLSLHRFVQGCLIGFYAFFNTR